MEITKEELKAIVIEEVSNQLTKENRTIRFLEDNGLELCGSWLTAELENREIELPQKQESECIDYMVEVFYEKVDEIINTLT
jgi:hypothetical protein